MDKFKVGQKVHTVKDHDDIGVTNKMVGIVTSVSDDHQLKYSVVVLFNNSDNIAFSPEELETAYTNEQIFGMLVGRSVILISLFLLGMAAIGVILSW